MAVFSNLNMRQLLLAACCPATDNLRNSRALRTIAFRYKDGPYSMVIVTKSPLAESSVSTPLALIPETMLSCPPSATIGSEFASDPHLK
jgi:hypothetical protein